MRIVIIGCGKIGGALAGLLSEEGHDIVAVDNREQVASKVSDLYDVMSIHGNGAALSVQREAQVDKADLVIAATGTDEANILCCMLAKKLGAKHTIARVRNPAYNEQLEFLREELGLSMYINPDLATAAEIFRTVRTPAAQKVETFAGGRAEIVELRLREDSGLDGVALKDVDRVTGVKMLVCAVRRGADVHIPNGDFVLKTGDQISIAASIREAEALFRRWGQLRRNKLTAMLMGGSRIAYYLAKQLLAVKASVTIVDSDPARCRELCELLPSAAVVCGDGTDPELLHEEGLGGCNAFVALTGDDENNIIVSMFANSKGVAKVVTKVNRPELAAMAADSLLESVVSPRSVCAGIILQYVRSMANTQGSNVETLHRIVGERVEALEFKVRPGSLVTAQSLRDLTLRPNLLIACIIRGHQVIIPCGDDQIAEGDHVIVVTTESGLRDLNEILP